jgi:hypothetical protein
MKARAIPLTSCAAAVASVMVLVGCTATMNSGEIDLVKVQEAIRAETGESVTIQCPEAVPFGTGRNSICPATVDGAKGMVLITQVDDQGNVDWTIRTTFNFFELNALVEAEIEAAAGSVTIQCPEDVPYEAGLVTVCAATIDGANARVAVTQVDDQGGASFVLDRTLSVDALPSMIEAEIGVPVEVQCPADIPLEEGLVVECLVSDGADEGVLVVTQTDNVGNLDWSWRGLQGD